MFHYWLSSSHSYGNCSQNSPDCDFCEDVISDDDLVYKAYSYTVDPGELGAVLREVQDFFDNGAAGASEFCMTVARQLLCIYYHPPCGELEDDDDVITKEFTIPMALCPGTCDAIDSVCGPLLPMIAEIFDSPPFIVPFVDCSDLAANIRPLRHCCIDVFSDFTYTETSTQSGKLLM